MVLYTFKHPRPPIILTVAWSFPFLLIAKKRLLKIPRIPTIPWDTANISKIPRSEIKQERNVNVGFQKCTAKGRLNASFLCLKVFSTIAFKAGVHLYQVTIWNSEMPNMLCILQNMPLLIIVAGITLIWHGYGEIADHKASQFEN